MIDTKIEIRFVAVNLESWVRREIGTDGLFETKNISMIGLSQSMPMIISKLFMKNWHWVEWKGIVAQSKDTTYGYVVSVFFLTS